MGAVKRSLAGVVAGLALVAVLPAGTAQATCYTNKPAERAFARRINADRKDRGKGWLRLDPQLSKAAKVHTREMLRRNTLFHTPSNTLMRRVTNWTVLGENVGFGGTVDSLHKAFMNSPAHKANILYSTFRYVGVGTAKKNGRLWVTVIFEAKTDPGSPLCR